MLDTVAGVGDGPGRIENPNEDRYHRHDALSDLFERCLLTLKSRHRQSHVSAARSLTGRHTWRPRNHPDPRA
jgi:hypothetical protein